MYKNYNLNKSRMKLAMTIDIIYMFILPVYHYSSGAIIWLTIPII